MHQEASTEELVSVPLAIFRQGDDGTIDAETDRLAEAMMISLRGDAAAATARANIAEDAAEQARGRLVQLNGEMVAAKARIVGLERTKAELEARLLAHADSDTDAATLEHLGTLLVAEQDKCSSLTDRLSVAEELAAKSGERGEQLADLTARYNHDRERLEAMTNDFHRVQLDLTIAKKNLGALEASDQALRNELRRVTESLALADRAKSNAVAAAEVRVREQLAASPAFAPAGMVMISAEELAGLREQSAEREGLKVRLSAVSGELRDVMTHVDTQSDAVEQGIRDLEFAKLELERYGCSIQEQALMIREMGRRLVYANMTIHLYHGRNNLPGFTREEGHVALFSLHTDCLIEESDAPVDKTRPLMWWTSRHGGGCMVALSANKDERGRQVVITPTLHHEIDGVAHNITDAVAPPVHLRDEIADYIAGLDRQALLDVVTDAEVRANDAAYASEPLLGSIDAAQKRLQARRQTILNSQSALVRAREKAQRQLAKQTNKANKAGKKGR